MPQFRIFYTRTKHCYCDVDAQNEFQIQHLFDEGVLDLSDEQSSGFARLGTLERIEKVPK